MYEQGGGRGKSHPDGRTLVRLIPNPLSDSGQSGRRRFTQDATCFLSNKEARREVQLIEVWQGRGGEWEWRGGGDVKRILGSAVGTDGSLCV